MEQILADSVHFRKVKKNVKMVLTGLIFKIYLQYVELIVLFAYNLDGLRFQKMGTKNRRLVNMKC
jgi:hypothetical protein